MRSTFVTFVSYRKPVGIVPAPECIFAGDSPRAERENVMTVPKKKASVSSSFLAHQASLGWIKVPPSLEIRYNVYKSDK